MEENNKRPIPGGDGKGQRKGENVSYNFQQIEFRSIIFLAQKISVLKIADSGH